MTEFTKMQQIKRRLYAMRNGALADSLRKAGCPRRLVFGVNLPQLTEIATEFGPDREMSEALRADHDLRESQLLAPMLFPVDELTIEVAEQWMAEMQWPEEMDILSFKLLRRASFAAELALRFMEHDDPKMRYAALRLYFNIVSTHPAEALAAAERELQRPEPLSTLASMLAEEAKFLLE